MYSYGILYIAIPLIGFWFIFAMNNEDPLYTTGQYMHLIFNKIITSETPTTFGHPVYEKQYDYYEII